MHIREKRIESYMRKKIKALGGDFLKFRSTVDGVPDRIAILPGGHIIFVELKTDEGDLSDLQEFMIDHLLDLGCEVDVIYGMEQAHEWIDRIRKEVVV